MQKETFTMADARVVLAKMTEGFESLEPYIDSEGVFRSLLPYNKFGFKLRTKYSREVMTDSIDVFVNQVFDWVYYVVRLNDELPKKDYSEGELHRVECRECHGSGRESLEREGGQDIEDVGECFACDGQGFCEVEACADHCDCENCTTGYWYWPAPVGEHPAVHFPSFDGAASAGPGDITRKSKEDGRYYKHVLVSVNE